LKILAAAVVVERKSKSADESSAGFADDTRTGQTLLSYSLTRIEVWQQAVQGWRKVPLGEL